MLARHVVALGFLVATSPLFAAPASYDEFDRVYPAEFRDTLRDAKLAYGKEDYATAFRLFERTACAGDKASQSALGRMYLLGQGTERDDLTGYAWLKLASEVIFPGYQRIVRDIEAALDAKQLALAREGAKQLAELYGIGATRISCHKNASRQGFIVDEIICTPHEIGNQYLLRRCVGAPPQ
jgi:hypothetical protein